MNGEKFLNRLPIGPVTDSQNKVFALIGVQTELADRAQASNVTAEEANVMLNETQHRVKNHLSMVASMIRTQKFDKDPVATYDILARRVEALSLLYDKLSAHEVGKEGNYDVISAGGYISRVAATVDALDGRKSIRLNVDTKAACLRTNDAAALGLLTLEVLANTLQHAFAGRSEGLVDVGLKSLTNGLIRLEIDDDGTGLGTSDWPYEGNLGARIARRLVLQLRGEIRVDTGGSGT